MKTLLISILIFSTLLATAQDYSNYAQQASRVEKIAKSYPQYARFGTIGKSASGKNIWLLSIGTGDLLKKPAIAIVGGIEGNHLLGTELAIGFAEKLLASSNTDSIRNLLSQTTYYVFPNMSPDATEQYFSKLKYERNGNASNTDDDRDGKSGEDGFDDLDGNGRITWMRVESPIGDYRIHPDDPRVMIKAEISKGEKGTHKIFTEGIDNDKDRQFNEDGEGGVWFNKNLGYRHPSFSPGAGEFPASESETRAILDTLYNLFNVFAVVSFGNNNNLSSPLAYNAQAAAQKMIGSWLEPDSRINAMASELYNKTVNAKDAPKTSSTGGDFLSWAYYHYGRYSFSTPGWWIPKAIPDTIKKEKPFSVEDATANYLRWSARQDNNSNFTEWKQINHPDFPGQKVEIGGVDPFLLVNPPYAMVDGIVKKHTDFLVKLAAFQPEIDIMNLKTEKLGNGITRITADVINRGAFASPSKLGERNYWVKRINVKLNTGNNQAVISGRKNQLLNSLEGYSSQQLTWLVKGNGQLSIEAGSPATGTKRIEINL